jgi:fibronectin-binding autotransporter adhesin
MGAHIFLVPRGGITFASNAVVSSTVSGFFGRDSSNNKRSLNLTIRDNASVAMNGCSFGGGKTGGSVTVTVQNNGALSFGANIIDLHDVANASAISTLRLNGGTTTVGGFTKTETSYTNIIDFNGGVLKAGANNSSFLPGFNFTTNAVQAGGVIIDDGGFAITAVGPLLHDPSLGSVPDGGLTKLGAGTLTLGFIAAVVQQTYSGPTMISAGTLKLVSNIASSSSVFVNAGALFDVSSSSFTITSGRTFWGNGSVNGNFTVASGAILTPGSNSIGTLTFSNSVSLAAGSTNIFEISHAPLTNDAAIIFGGLTNGGTLIVSNVGATQLAAGDTFKLFNASSHNGAFSNVNLPLLPFGLAWNTNNLNTAGSISVVLNTTPVIGSISISGNGLGLSGTGGVGNAYYILLGTTNLSTTPGGWMPLLTNQFDSSGNFNFTTNANTGTPQNFYRLQLQ